MIGGEIQDEDTIEDVDDNTSPQIVEIDDDFHRSPIDTQYVVEGPAEDPLPEAHKLADNPQTDETKTFSKGKKTNRVMCGLGLSTELVISPLLGGEGKDGSWRHVR